MRRSGIVPFKAESPHVPISNGIYLRKEGRREYVSVAIMTAIAMNEVGCREVLRD